MQDDQRVSTPIPIPRMQRVKQLGAVGVVEAIRARVRPWRMRDHQAELTRFTGNGLEIGGPSAVFGTRGLLPVYDRIDALDNVNFSVTTLWEGQLKDGGPYVFDRRHRPGRQFIREATDLVGLPSARYDFVLSSHTLEHLANPLRALREWHRVLKADGILALVVPLGSETFDRLRPTTRFEHLISDLQRDVGEDDDTHLEEARKLHDGRRDEAILPSGVLALPNVATRAVHHHVFDMPLLTRAVASVGYRVIASDFVRPYHLVVIARALARGVADRARGPL